MKKRILTTIALLSITALSASALPPPEKDEMTIAELQTQLFSLDGKIIETEITSVSSFEQIAPGKYRAYCYYYKGGGSVSSGESVLIPEEGKEFFEELAKKDFFNGGSKTVYLLVHSEKPIRVKGSYSYKLEAVGERYRKSKGTYKW